MIGICILCISFIIYSLHLNYQYNKKLHINSYKKINVCDAEPGDIILFSHDYLYELNAGGYIFFNLVQSIFSKDLFTHCGIVVRYKNRKCLLHLTYQITKNHLLDDYTNEIPTIIDLEDYIQTYNGVCLLYKNQRIDSITLNNYLIDEYLTDSVRKFQKITFNILRWFIDGIFDLNMFKDDTKTCYEFVHDMLSSYTKIKCECYRNMYSSTLRDYLIRIGYTQSGFIDNYYLNKIII